MTKPSPLILFRNKDYLYLWGGGFASLLATFAQIIARGWLALELTGSNTGLGLVTFGFGVVSVFATPMGGVLADRMAKRTLLVAASSLLVVSSAWIAIAEIGGFLQFWMLMAASGIQALGFAATGPTRIAYIGELVQPNLRANAVVLSQVALNINRVIGPSLAGVMISIDSIGPGGVFAFSAVLSAISLVLFLFLPPGLPDPNRPKRAPLAELGDGIRYARRNVPVKALLLTSAVVIMVGFPYVSFLPSVAHEFFDAGASGFSTMTVVGAFGGLAVSVVITFLASGRIAWVIQALSGLGFGGCVILLGLSPNFAVALVVLFVLGAANSAFQSMSAALVLGLSEQEYHGRMQSLFQLGFSGYGLASYPLGVLADAVGLRDVLVASGALVIAAMVFYLVARPSPVV